MSNAGGIFRVDAHHHLWHYTAEEFGWLNGELEPLRRDFLREEFLCELQSAEVDASVTVQARQTVAETTWLLKTADATPEIVGVVGWLPIASEHFPAMLKQLEGAAKLKGLRHVVQAEGAGFLDGNAFNCGIHAMLGTGLVYDILVLQHQLPEVIRFVDKHSSQQFVLDHLAKPLIHAREMDPWSTNLRELARRPNVFCKLSGMVTEAGAGWTVRELEPYFEVALEAFGPDRIMVGSDWPVLTAHCGYADWWRIVQGWTEALSTTEQTAILGGTAARIYQLRHL